MPAGVVLGAVYSAVRAILLVDSVVIALLAKDARNVAIPGIYTEGAVPQGAAYPYLTIGLGTQTDDHTMGSPQSKRYGWNCTLQIKAVTQSAGEGGEDEGLAIMNAVAAVAYEGRDLIDVGGSPGFLDGYETAWCDEMNVQPTLTTIQQGVTTRELPAILRVRAYD